MASQNEEKHTKNVSSRNIYKNDSPQQKLARTNERRVPASRAGRLLSFGSLALNIGIKALGNVAKGAVKGDVSTVKNTLLTPSTAQSVVDTLCHVRGAAMKLGQMLSLQDNQLINPEIQDIFSQMRHTANFMPKKQLNDTLSRELGREWRSKFSEFDEKPLTAASIGQVHKAITKAGISVAVKVQYPGISRSISSDIDNVASVLRLTGILPPGLYAEKMLAVARKELAWEVDYEREYDCLNMYKRLVENDDELEGAFGVPDTVQPLCTKHVLTCQFVDGITLDDAAALTQDERNQICHRLIQLCLKEVFEYNLMQTDPNWSNFLYSPDANKIWLVDFGASRSFNKATFTDHYIQVLKGAALSRPDIIVEKSQQLGFLTGYEAKEMTDAHVKAVMILGEPLRHDGFFDFGSQMTTGEIHRLIVTMLHHRLTPPPEETYSLHRKLAGAFLLCNKLSAKVPCKEIFDRLYARYSFTQNSSEVYFT